ncbi:hypothetical protein [Candidatus Chlamydia corallus]|uniref:hypothetical protein n=1 Tax=Candidatus Chlamydia corallus TaxID=2038470 RepID=UPI000C2FA245|nr:hypothetical protein [Candidatus Chlamydia corallus]
MTRISSTPDVGFDTSQAVDSEIHAEQPNRINKQGVAKIAKIAIAVLALATAIGSGIVAVIFGMPLLLIVTGVALIVAAVALYLLFKKKPSETLPEPGKDIPPTRVPITPLTPPLNEMLKNNWTLLGSLSEINGSWMTREPNQKYYAWHYLNSKTTLIVTTGDISQPRLKTKERVMIVNSANKEMLPGGGGTNAALSRATHTTCWENSKTGGGRIYPSQPLSVCECRSTHWINQDGSMNDPTSGKPLFLAQLLGPKYSGELKEHPEKVESIVKEAYTNCLSEALLRDVSLLQIPLISSGIYSPGGSLEIPPVDETQSASPQYKLYHIHMQWIENVKKGLLQAVETFATTHKDIPMNVVLTDYNTLLITPPN